MIEWLDTTVLDWFQGIHNPVLTPVMHLFTLLGEGGGIWIILGLSLLVRKETRRTGMVVLLALLFCLISCNLILKNIVARPRPCWRNMDVVLLIRSPQDFSFPSGHTASSFAAAFSLFLWKRRWGMAAIFAAVVIAASRLYFYVHYPTDVLMGAVLGVMMAFLAHLIIVTLEKKGVFTWLKVQKSE